jgi:hypothetical protein
MLIPGDDGRKVPRTARRAATGNHGGLHHDFQSNFIKTILNISSRKLGLVLFFWEESPETPLIPLILVKIPPLSIQQPPNGQFLRRGVLRFRASGSKALPEADGLGMW